MIPPRHSWPTRPRAGTLACTLLVIFAAAGITAPVIGRRFPGVPEGVLTFGVATLGLVGVLLLVRTGLGLVSWCMRRRVMRELPIPETIDGEAG